MRELASQIAAAVELLFSVANDDAASELETLAIASGWLLRCDVCGDNVPVDAEMCVCGRRMDEQV